MPASDPITAALNIGGQLIERLFPDPTQRAQATLQLEELKQKGELAQMASTAGLMQGQIDVNKIEAASASLFVAGWRPFVGWIAGGAFGLAYIPKAIMMCLVWSVQAFTIIKGWSPGTALTLPTYPDMALTDILGLLAALLGMGTLRSVDKYNGTASGH